MKKHDHKHLLQNVAIATVLALPFLLPQPSGSLLTGDASSSDIRQRAADYLPQLHSEQRMYEAYRAACRDRLAADPKTVCPSYADKDAVKAFLNGEEPKAQEAEMHPAADSTLNVEDLSELDQHLMRWYQTVNSCPTTLQNYLPGFYELCTSLLRDEPSTKHAAPTSPVEQRRLERLQKLAK